MRPPDLAFVAVVLVVFAVLVSLQLSGTSLASLSLAWRQDPSLVAGTPRSVRADELVIQTPNSVGNARRGLPEEPWFGLVQLRLPAVTLGGPSSDWTTVAKPQDWGYVLLNAARGLAWHWWFSFAAALLGLYALLVVLTGRRALATGLSVVGSFTPYTGWWSSPSTALVLGFGCGAAAAAVSALRARRLRALVLHGLLTAYLLAALFFLLYPPWAISVGLVALAVTLGQAVDHRVGLRRLLVTAGVVLVPLGAALAVWYVENRAAITATLGTFYPGNRVSHAGTAYAATLLDAPVNWWLSLGWPQLDPNTSERFINFSELSSSWFPLPVLLVALGVNVWVFRRRSRARAGTVASPEPGATAVPAAPAQRPRPLFATLVAVAAVMALLLGWALLPLPDVVGTVTLLNRVPPVRLPLALGLCAVLLTAASAELLRRRRPSWPVAFLWALGALSTVGLTVWAARSLPWDDPTGNGVLVALSGLVVGAGFALVAAGVRPALVLPLLAAYCALSWAVVNPLYRGLGVLDRDPLAVAMREWVEANGSGPVAVYGPRTLVPFVVGSGAESVSGVTFYPDEELMRTLAPDQRGRWNNYANYGWVADASADPAEIAPVRGTAKELRIDPCAPETLDIGIELAVSADPLFFPCLQFLDVVRREAGNIYRYDVVRP